MLRKLLAFLAPSGTRPEGADSPLRLRVDHLGSGGTVEFYAAREDQIVPLLQADDDDSFDRLSEFPSADFSLHLALPDDLHRLAVAMSDAGLEVPRTFDELLMREVFHDESGTTQLFLLSNEFPDALSSTTDQQLRSIATAWADAFEVKDPAMQAVLELREVCRAARDGSAVFLLVVY